MKLLEYPFKIRNPFDLSLRRKPREFPESKVCHCERPSLEETMNNCHRMFLQSMMSKGIMNAKDTFTALKSSCEKYEEFIANFHDDQRKLLIDFVHQINDCLRPMGMEIKKGVDELSGAGYYGIVNMTENSITLHASHYTENELQFFKNLLELIVLSNAGFRRCLLLILLNWSLRGNG